MGLMAYEIVEETVHKMQALFIIWVFQKQKKSINKLLHKVLDQMQKFKTTNQL